MPMPMSHADKRLGDACNALMKEKKLPENCGDGLTVDGGIELSHYDDDELVAIFDQANVPAHERTAIIEDHRRVNAK